MADKNEKGAQPDKDEQKAVAIKRRPMRWLSPDERKKIAEEGARREAEHDAWIKELIQGAGEKKPPNPNPAGGA